MGMFTTLRDDPWRRVSPSPSLDANEGDVPEFVDDRMTDQEKIRHLKKIAQECWKYNGELSTKCLNLQSQLQAIKANCTCTRYGIPITSNFQFD
jgi:hypothetical protein